MWVYQCHQLAHLKLVYVWPILSSLRCSSNQCSGWTCSLLRSIAGYLETYRTCCLCTKVRLCCACVNTINTANYVQYIIKYSMHFIPNNPQNTCIIVMGMWRKMTSIYLCAMYSSDSYLVPRPSQLWATEGVTKSFEGLGTRLRAL